MSEEGSSSVETMKQEDTTAGNWAFIAYEWNTMKFQSIHLFQDDDQLIPTSNLVLSLVFYICCVVAFALLTTVYRCEVLENQIGVQQIGSVNDCNNLVMVNCADTCGKIYGDVIERSVPNSIIPESLQSYSFNQGAYDMLRSSDQNVITGSCSLPGFTTIYYSFLLTGHYTGVITQGLYFTSEEECTQAYSAFANLAVGTMIDCCQSFVSVTTCEQVFPPCTCDSSSAADATRAVTNTASCKAYFANKDATWVNSLAPLSHCDGTLREVTECKDTITLIGTFGGYVSLLYSAVGVLFFISLSRAKFFGLQSHVNRNERDTPNEIGMTSMPIGDHMDTHIVL